MSRLARCVCHILVQLAAASAPPAAASELLRDRLEHVVSANGLAYARDGEPFQLRAFAADLLFGIYERRKFGTLWTEPRAAELIALIRDAPSHGLRASDYLLAELEAHARLDDLDARARADADLLLTEALLRYGDHRAFGKVHPQDLDPSWHYAGAHARAERLQRIDDLIDAGDLSIRLERALSHGFLYENLRGWLVRYRRFVEAGGWSSVSSGPTLHPGDRSARIVEVRRRLDAEGFATEDLALDLYDDVLEARVREFQERYGLGVDGLIGRRTLAAMNVSAEVRVDQIRVNLERLRWVAADWEPRFIGVNIAGFRVYLIEGDAVRWSARAVIGRTYRRTPVFRADVTHLVLNPDWTVPPTILKHDTLPAIHANPGYLEANEMDVLDYSGRLIDASTIDWTRYPGDPFPYLIRQRPGPRNALGRIKLVFPNDHAVFMHDTPAKNLFEQSERVFSSGCIRVERPLELAAQTLRDNPGWDVAALEGAIATGVTQTVSLATPLPILVMYLTAAAFEGESSFNFFNDVYRRDSPVLAALDAAPTFAEPRSATAP